MLSGTVLVHVCGASSTGLHTCPGASHGHHEQHPTPTSASPSPGNGCCSPLPALILSLADSRPFPQGSGKIPDHLYLTQSTPMRTEGGLSYDRLLAARDYLVMESNTSFRRHPEDSHLLPNGTHRATPVGLSIVLFPDSSPGHNPQGPACAEPQVKATS